MALGKVDVGDLLQQVKTALDLLFLQRLFAEGRDGDRYILRRFHPLLRGDDDLCGAIVIDGGRRFVGARRVDQEQARLPTFHDQPGPPKQNIKSSARSEEHTSELQSLIRTSYAVYCLKKKKRHT